MKRWRTRLFVLILAALVPGCASEPEEPRLEDRLQTLVEQSVADAGFELGVAVHVDSPQLGIEWESAVGLADPETGEPMTPAHPVRIASNTKTYLAVAALGLWERGQLDLDAAITEHLPSELVSILEEGGYTPQDMSIRHLLTHTAGLVDHGASDQYGKDIVANPQKRWTRADQVRICIEVGGPLAEPGQVFHYSDTGYVLLGEILEQVTGENLAGAVWGVIDRDALGLHETWFETLEARPEGVRERAHQLFGEVDVTGFDPSFDLWGGGGIATTVGDLARFMRALFEGRVLERAETLEEMLSTFEGLGPAPGADEGALAPGAYRKGIWVLPAEGHTIHRHTGFWGTSATWVPELDLVFTYTVNQHGPRELFNALHEGMLEILAGAESS